MPKVWPAKVKAAAVADLEGGGTVPAVSKAHGVPIGTLRAWKRAARRAREPAKVLNLKGEPAELDPDAQELADLTSEDPEVAIQAQMRVLIREKREATGIGQYGAAATMQKQIATLRADLTTHRATRPKADPLDMPEAEVLRKLSATARRWPASYLEAVVVVFCERFDVTVEAAHG